MILQFMSSDTLYEKRYVEVAKTNEIEPGQLKHVEVEGKEILISNIDGKFYSLDDRCSHMNASLAKGKVIGSDVVCAFHAAKFNISTGAWLIQLSCPHYQWINYLHRSKVIMKA